MTALCKLTIRCCALFYYIIVGLLSRWPLTLIVLFVELKAFVGLEMLELYEAVFIRVRFVSKKFAVISKF